MTELSKETVQFLTRVIKVAKILKIEHIILDKECVRGHHETEGSLIIERNIPALEFDSIGISRLETLSNRLNLLGENVTINAEEKTDSKIISKLVMCNDKTEVEFKCANPALLPQGKKVIKDPVFYTFTMLTDSITLLLKAQSAVKGETIALVGSKSGVVVKLNDVEGDMLNHIAATDIAYSTDCDKDKFYFSYKNKVLLLLLREAIIDDKVEINITRRGILNLEVLGINVYISPEL